MKMLTVGIATVALSLALVGCGTATKTETESSTQTTAASSAAPTTTKAPAANATIDDYIKDNKIQETVVHHGDPGAPTIDLPTPDGWKVLEESDNAPYGGLVVIQAEDPSDPPTITAKLSKLTGNVDPAKILEHAPGDLKNLPGFEGFDEESPDTLSGFQAYRFGGQYTKDGKKRMIAQKTVVIPAEGAVYLLVLTAEALDGQEAPLIEATSVIDEQTTITV